MGCSYKRNAPRIGVFALEVSVGRWHRVNIDSSCVINNSWQELNSSKTLNHPPTAICEWYFIYQTWSSANWNMNAKNQHILYDDADITKAARCLKAMSHPLRLKILCILGEKSFSVQDIVEQVGTSQSNISQHLSILRDKNILGCTKEANRVYYFIDDQRVLQLINMMQDVFCSKKQ